MLRSLLFALVLLLPIVAGASSLGEPRVRGGIASPPVVYGDFVYAASGISIQVSDVSDAAHPRRVPFEPSERPPGTIFGLAVVGDYLYVGWSDDAQTNAGFQIYSLADPARPVHVGDAATTRADVLLTNGDYLYEVSSQRGVFAIDASDPLRPVFVGNATGSIRLPPSVLYAQIANGHLYVSGGGDIEACWAVILDLADPAHPVSVGEVPLGSFSVLEAVSESGYAYARGDVGGIYDLHDPTHVARLGELPGSDLIVRGAIRATFRGDTLYLFGDDYLPIYDVSNPLAPVQVAQTSISTNDLATLVPLPNGFLATTAKGRGGLIDASEPLAPTLRTEISVPSVLSIYGAALDDRNAYLIGEGHTLEVVDTASLANVGVLDAPADDEEGAALAGATSIALSNTTAIVAGYRELFAIDVADRANPRVAGSLPLGFFGDVLVAGDRAYTPTDHGALTVIDFADPSAPVVRGSVTGAFNYRPLAAGGSLVFSFGTDFATTAGVYIVDARDASHPFLAGSYIPCYGSSFDTLAASGNGATLAVACADASVEIVDTRNPAAATLRATYRPPAPADLTTAMAANGTTFYLGNAHGIDEIDASDPDAPAFVVRHPTASWVQALRVSPNGSLLALTFAGMYVFDCVASGGERPAPCRGGATIMRPPLAHSQHGSPR